MQRWPVQVGTRRFQIDGYIFAQQNSLTNVCAHVGARTVASRFHPNGDITYREINRLLGIDHDARKLVPEGVAVNEIVQILAHAGAKCFQADYAGGFPAVVPFQKYIYGSIESGYPAILVFSTQSPTGDMHAIPIFGHTLNQDTWVPRAEASYFRIGGTAYIPSESWLSNFIVHDDNWGPNFCVPRHYLRQRAASADEDAQTPAEQVAHVIATFPKRVKVNAIRAEVVGADYLFSMLRQLPQGDNPWASRLVDYANRQQLVLRPVLLENEAYADHLENLEDWEGVKLPESFVKVLRELLKGSIFWMVELSVPELFSANLRKIGEVLIRADCEPTSNRDLSAFFLARLPGYFALYQSGDAQNPKYKFFPNHLRSHVPLAHCEHRGL